MIGVNGFETHAKSNLTAYNDNYPSDTLLDSTITKLGEYKNGDYEGTGGPAVAGRAALLSDLQDLLDHLTVRRRT